MIPASLMAMMQPVLQELRERFGRIEEAQKAAASEQAHRRKLGLMEIPWDDVRTYTVANGDDETKDLLADWGRLGVEVRVVSATSGAELGLSGGDTFAVATGDHFKGGRIARLRLDNASGSGNLVVAVFLAVGQAAGSPY